MNGLVLRLFFHGLIAFAPDGPGGMDAYLVKHTGHVPALMFEMTRTSICPAVSLEELLSVEEPPLGLCFKAGNIVSSWCLCLIGDDVSISFQPQTVGPTRPIDDKPDGPAPESKAASADFSWLVRMSNIQDGNSVRIKKNFEQIRPLVSARMSFKWLSERSCHLDQISTCKCEEKPSEDCEFKVHPFGFTGVCGVAAHSQALSEYAAFELRLPFRPVRLILGRNSDGESKSKEMGIDLGCGPRECPDVLIANRPTDQICDEKKSSSLSTHFIAYYELAQDAESLKKLLPVRLVESTPLLVKEEQLFNCPNDPLRKFKTIAEKQLKDLELSPPLAVSSQNLALFIKALRIATTAAETRIICPMAMFDR